MVSQSGHSDTVSRGIRVHVAAQVLSDCTECADGVFLYAYRVMITNESDHLVKLLSRHWEIRDADNNVRHVRGAGVVGRQPELVPGSTFTYMSSAAMPTEWGTMEGSFRFRDEDNSLFDARIGRFFLAPTTAPIEELQV